ncbi:MAG: cell wall-binding repeat-containing protein [Bacillota bacterium]|nr:cell wall-binding repeat-containing protein [Bacillota bacterium]
MKKLLSFLLFVLIFTFSAGMVFADSTTSRIDGNDRFDVANNLANREWSAGADKVVLVNYDAFADALAAAPLAYHYNAPILLTEPNQLTQSTKDEIQQVLHPKEVIIIGGEGSVSNEVVSELQAMSIPTVRRIDGQDRFEVSKNVANELPPSSKVVVADGLNFPDALSIAPYAAQNGYPILLGNETDNLPDQTKQAILSRNPSASIIVGGTASVSQSIETQVPSPTRIGGQDRYEVSSNIVKTLNLSTAQTFVATGSTFADALTGSVVAAKENAPILLTETNSVPSSIRQLVVDKSISNFIVLGGTGSVSATIPAQLIGQPAGQLQGLKIVVDAGHGGIDNGASGNNLLEKNVTLAVAEDLKTLLINAGANVVMTRDSDSYPTLQDRVDIANSIHADSFISIHCNASTSTASGTETYWNSQYVGTQSQELAQDIQTQMVTKLGTVDRGVKESDFYVIKNTTMPSVLAELAFITNSSDAAKLGNPLYQEAAAEAIFTGYLNYFKK